MSDKSIHQLIPDIQDLLKRKDGWFDAELARTFSDDIASRVSAQLGVPGHQPTLRLSQMGARCPRALWYSIHHPDLREPLPPWAELKYVYGHILEALVLKLAKAAGHTVEGEQDEVVVDGIVGHRDAIIDGCLVDVKSSSSRGMEKFKNSSASSLAARDDFGYLEQLDGYLLGSSLHDILKVKDRGYILAIDKTLGHMELYEHRLREHSIRSRIREYKQIVALPSPPECNCGTKSEGQSGNVRLDTRASYSPYKYACFPNLRTFLYASGPVYLTKVVRKPDVTEVDRYGKVVYN